MNLLTKKQRLAVVAQLIKKTRETLQLCQSGDHYATDELYMCLELGSTAMKLYPDKFVKERYSITRPDLTEMIFPEFKSLKPLKPYYNTGTTCVWFNTDEKGIQQRIDTLRQLTKLIKQS